MRRPNLRFVTKENEAELAEKMPGAVERANAEREESEKLLLAAQVEATLDKEQKGE